MKSIEDTLKLESVDEIEKEIKERKYLLTLFVGDLYPGIVRDEITKLEKRIKEL